MKSLGSPVHNRLYSANVRFPNFVGSSMGMADLVAKVYALLTDITFSHHCTSFIQRPDHVRLSSSDSQNHNICILTDLFSQCKKNFKKPFTKYKKLDIIANRVWSRTENQDGKRKRTAGEAMQTVVSCPPGTD